MNPWYKFERTCKNDSYEFPFHVSHFAMKNHYCSKEFLTKEEAFQWIEYHKKNNRTFEIWTDVTIQQWSGKEWVNII